MRITGLKKKLISLIVAVIMTVSGMYVENINIDSSFVCEDTANQNFIQAAHLSRPSESCTEELLGNRETGRITAGYRRLSEKNNDLEGAALSLAAVLPENRQKTAGTLNYGNQRCFGQQECHYRLYPSSGWSEGLTITS